MPASTFPTLSIIPNIAISGQAKLGKLLIRNLFLIIERALTLSFPGLYSFLLLNNIIPYYAGAILPPKTCNLLSESF
jgi:hypothetical protein